jgi:aryl-alcohol dehydrogenase-like predicted oxidoreductase
MGRREFIKRSAAAVGGTALISAAGSKTDELIHRNERSTMTYRQLGRTKFMSSRLIFGCGAALVGGKAVRLLDRAFDAGINHYDVGSNVYYKESERYLAPFLKAHRDDVWVASKAMLSSIRIEPDESVTRQQAATAAKYWTKLLDASLVDLQSDHVDLYYLMAVENPIIARSEELYKAFTDAKAAGKVSHFGLSAHKNTTKVLEAAIGTGWYDVVMVGVTPAGWYDWIEKEIEKDTPTMIELQPLLNRCREAGMGLVGIKAVRFLAPMSALGKGDPTLFDHHYSGKMKESPLNPFQRAYAYVLEHGLDAVNADMQNFKHLEENIIAAATSQQYFA